MLSAISRFSSTSASQAVLAAFDGTKRAFSSRGARDSDSLLFDPILSYSEFQRILCHVGISELSFLKDPNFHMQSLKERGFDTYAVGNAAANLFGVRTDIAYKDLNGVYYPQRQRIHMGLIMKRISYAEALSKSIGQKVPASFHHGLFAHSVRRSEFYRSYVQLLSKAASEHSQSLFLLLGSFGSGKSRVIDAISDACSISPNVMHHGMINADTFKESLLQLEHAHSHGSLVTFEILHAEAREINIESAKLMPDVPHLVWHTMMRPGSLDNFLKFATAQDRHILAFDILSHLGVCLLVLCCRNGHGDPVVPYSQLIQNTDETNDARSDTIRAARSGKIKSLLLYDNSPSHYGIQLAATIDEEKLTCYNQEALGRALHPTPAAKWALPLKSGLTLTAKTPITPLVLNLITSHFYPYRNRLRSGLMPHLGKTLPEILDAKAKG